MFLFDWFFSLLRSLGLWGKTGKVLLLGCDNAGKTTLLHLLKTEKIGIFVPTRNPTSEVIRIANLTITAHDLGGHKAARRLWASYFPDASAIVYMIDVADKKRIEETREELNKIVMDQRLAGVPVLVLGNKVDKKESALSEEQLKYALGLEGACTGKDGRPKSEINARPLEIFMCSVTSRFGFADGFKWLANYFE